MQQCVFDIGFHKGEDTEHYLSKGFKVIAVEANPQLVKEGQKKFEKAISNGQLVLVNKGIAEKPGVLTFWINHKYSEWSSFDKEIGCRDNTGCHAIEVECITIDTLIAEYGLPVYLKIDIEGNDIFCIKGLNSERLPPYISCEACYVTWLEELKAKGYSKFKIINQRDGFSALIFPTGKSSLRMLRNKLSRRLLKTFPFLNKYTIGGSGPFGEDTPGDWKDFDTAKKEYLSLFNSDGQLVNPRIWFDFHGKV